MVGDQVVKYFIAIPTKVAALHPSNQKQKRDEDTPAVEVICLASLRRESRFRPSYTAVFALLVCREIRCGHLAMAITRSALQSYLVIINKRSADTQSDLSFRPHAFLRICRARKVQTIGRIIL